MSRDPKFAPDPTAAYLSKWLDEHATPSDHDRRIVDADLLPGSSRGYVGDEDPYGKRADAAAAEAWWDMTEPDKGRWAC